MPTTLPYMAPAIAAINHLLAQEPWARQQLALHAGKLVAIDTGLLVLRIAVTADGYTEAASNGQLANVTIHVKLSDLPLILQNRERAFSYVKIDGDADFANTISQLSKSVRWEAEYDLEKLFGPIAATRLAGGARGLFGALRSGQQKLAENVAEFFLDEQPLLVRPNTVADWSSGVVRTRDDVERLAKRIDKIEQKLAQQAGATATKAVIITGS